MKSSYNKFKISAPTWNDKFYLPNGSYYISDIQDHFEYSIKKYKTLTGNPSLKKCINKIENRIIFKIKTGNIYIYFFQMKYIFCISKYIAFRVFIY